MSFSLRPVGRGAGLGKRRPGPRVGLVQGSFQDHHVDFRLTSTPDQRPTLQDRDGRVRACPCPCWHGQGQGQGRAAWGGVCACRQHELTRPIVCMRLSDFAMSTQRPPARAVATHRQSSAAGRTTMSTVEVATEVPEATDAMPMRSPLIPHVVFI